MEKFNFDAPITATVIFDDDVETSHIINKETEKNTEIVTNENGIQKVLQKNKDMAFQSNETPTNIFTKPTVKQKKKVTQIIQEQTTASDREQTVKIANSEIDRNKSEKRKALDMPYLDIDTVSMELNNVTNEIVINKNKESPANAQKGNNKPHKRKLSARAGKSPKRKSSKEPNLSVNTDQEVGTENSRQLDTNKNNAQHVNHDNNKDVAPNGLLETYSQAYHDCMKKFLDTVSENLICIVNAYYAYLQQYKTTGDRSLVEQARIHFLNTKNHFFVMSYNAVVTIILPREHDRAFIDRFIESTVMLSSSNLYNYSAQHMQPLFFEMIHWVKKRRKIVDSTKYKSANPLLMKILNEPHRPLQGCYQTDIGINDLSNNLNIFNTNYTIPTEPSRTNINIEPTYLNHHNNLRQPCNTNIVKPIQNTHEHGTGQSCYLENHHDAFVQFVNRDQTMQNKLTNTQMSTKPQSSFPPSKAPPEYTSRVNYKQCNTGMHINNIANPLYPVNENKSVEHSYQNYNNGPIQTCCTKISSPPQNAQECNTNQIHNVTNNHENYPTLEDSCRALQTEIHILQNQIKNKKDNDISNSYQKEVARYGSAWQTEVASAPEYNPYQQVNISQYTQDIRTDIPVPELQRSSISRDSGFISPLNFTQSSDQARNLQEQNAQSTSRPVITHVTSLNPQASYIITGNCSVCHKTTKNKCRGCYKSYYCSTECQYLDWASHMPECK